MLHFITVLHQRNTNNFGAAFDLFRPLSKASYLIHIFAQNNTFVCIQPNGNTVIANNEFYCAIFKWHDVVKIYENEDYF